MPSDDVHKGLMSSFQMDVTEIDSYRILMKDLMQFEVIFVKIYMNVRLLYCYFFREKLEEKHLLSN